MAATVTINVKVNSDKAANTFKKLKDQVLNLADAINRELKTATISFDKEMIKLNRGIDGMSTSMYGLGNQFKAASYNIESVTHVSRKSGIEIRNIGHSASEAMPKVSGFFKNMLATATGVLSANVLTSIAGKLKDITGVMRAGDFEDAAINFEALSGNALKNAGFSLDSVKAKALQLGAATQFSAQEALDAMTELLKGGVSITDVMNEAASATLALASATGLQLAPAAEIVSKQLGIWRDTGIKATQVVDVMAAAVNASTLDMDGLAIGLANAGGTARTVGVNFDELNTTLALLSAGFASGSDAGTSLKTFLSRLVPSTKPATESMQQLGLMTFNTTKAMNVLRMKGINPAGKSTLQLRKDLVKLAETMFKSKKQQKDFLESFDHSAFFDATGKFIGMEKSIGLLSEALEGVSNEDRIKFLNDIFGQDAIRAADILARQGVKGWKDTVAAMEESGGALAAAQKKNQGFNFSLESMKGSFETLQIIIGSLFTPALTRLMDNHITPAINTLGNFVLSLKGISEGFNALSPRMQRVALATQSVITAFGEQGLGSAFRTAMVWIDPLIPVMEAKINELGAKTQARVISIVPVVVAGFNELGTTIINWASEQAPKLIAAFAEWRVAATLWILQAIPGLTTGLLTFLDHVGVWLKASVPILGSLLTSWAEAFLTWIGPATAMLIIQLGEMYAQISLWLIQRAPGIAEAFGSWMKEAALWFLGTGLPLLLQAIGTVLLTIIGKITFAFSDAFKNGSLGRYIIDSIISGISSGWGRVSNWISSKLGLASAPTGTGSLAGARAGGGSVTGGRSYLVGELGPELFVPKSSGSIIPNSKIAGKAAPVININITGNNIDSDQREQSLAARVKDEIMSALSGGVDQFVLGGST